MRNPTNTTNQRPIRTVQKMTEETRIGYEPKGRTFESCRAHQQPKETKADRRRKRHEIPHAFSLSSPLRSPHASLTLARPVILALVLAAHSDVSPSPGRSAARSAGRP